MKAPSSNSQQSSFLMPSLDEQCDPRQPLVKLAQEIDWQRFEEAFGEYYGDQGRPAKPVRLMVGLLLLKHLENLSDEVLIQRWVQNPYYQLFCGMTQFQWELPCHPTDLVYFRRRIGEEGCTLLLQSSAQMHGEALKEREIVVGTTVQEKNITHPTDTELYRKIIERCWKLADQQGVKLRRRYAKDVKNALLAQRWRGHPKRAKQARKGVRRLRTIAGGLIRELRRKLPPEEVSAHEGDFELYQRVLNQKPKDKNKIYSLHEPEVYCVAKGKAHKKYEFGSKASVAMTKEKGVIVAAVAHPENIYDGHTLPEVLEVTEAIMGNAPNKAIVDRGYRGRQKVGETEILTPGKPPKGQTRSQKQSIKKRFRRRAAIEPLIGHLKQDYRLARCYLKGQVGDQINLLLAATAWNLNKRMRELLLRLAASWLRLVHNAFVTSPSYALAFR